MHRLLAIDPGLGGAACLFVCGSVVPIEPEGIIDMPVIGADKQHEIDGIAFRNWMLRMQPDSAIIEQVNGMPSVPDKRTGLRRQMGGTSAFNFGGSYRLLKWLPLLFNIPTRTVMPGKWKKHYGLKGGNEGKEHARQLALQRWPSLAPFLARKRDSGRAEAVLIANHHWETELRG